jgi:hypothetical protein
LRFLRPTSVIEQLSGLESLAEKRFSDTLNACQQQLT